MKKYRDVIKSDFVYNDESAFEPIKFICKPIEIKKYKDKIVSIYFSVPFEGELEFIQINNIENQRIVKNLELNKTYRIYAYWKEYYLKGIDHRGHLLVIAKAEQMPDYNIKDVEGFSVENINPEFLSKQDVLQMLQQSINPDLHYVYGLADPLKNKLFYIGKGKGDRIFKHEIEKRETNALKKYIQLSRNAWGFGLKYQIFNFNLSEIEAFELEESIIKRYGRRFYDNGGILTNLLEGGRDKRGKYLHSKKHGNGFFENGKLMQMFEITGFYYLQDEIKNLVISTLNIGDELTLKPDRENQYDKTAIKVLFRNTQIGWVSKHFHKKEQLYNDLMKGKEVKVVCRQKVVKPKDSNSLPPRDDERFYRYNEVKLIEGKYEIES